MEVTVVQTGVIVFLASSSANFHIKHVFQAFHYLKRTEGTAWVTLFRSERMAALLSAGGGMKRGGKDALTGLVHAPWSGGKRMWNLPEPLWEGSLRLDPRPILYSLIFSFLLRDLALGPGGLCVLSGYLLPA